MRKQSPNSPPVYDQQQLIQQIRQSGRPVEEMKVQKSTANKKYLNQLQIPQQQMYVQQEQQTRQRPQKMSSNTRLGGVPSSVAMTSMSQLKKKSTSSCSQERFNNNCANTGQQMSLLQLQMLNQQNLQKMKTQGSGNNIIHKSPRTRIPSNLVQHTHTGVVPVKSQQQNFHHFESPPQNNHNHHTQINNFMSQYQQQEEHPSSLPSSMPSSLVQGREGNNNVAQQQRQHQQQRRMSPNASGYLFKQPNLSQLQAQTQPPPVCQLLLTCAVLEAKLMINTKGFFSMSFYCVIKFSTCQELMRDLSTPKNSDQNKKDETIQVQTDVEEKKTAAQTGDNPKWSECFTFQFDNRQMPKNLEIAVYSKSFLSSDQLMGKAVFKIYRQNMHSSSNTEWVILKNSDNQVIGSILVCITQEQLNNNDISSSDCGNLDEEFEEMSDDQEEALVDDDEEEQPTENLLDNLSQNLNYHNNSSHLNMSQLAANISNHRIATANAATSNLNQSAIVMPNQYQQQIYLQNQLKKQNSSSHQHNQKVLHTQQPHHTQLYEHQIQINQPIQTQGGMLLKQQFIPGAAETTHSSNVSYDTRILQQQHQFQQALMAQQQNQQIGKITQQQQRATTTTTYELQEQQLQRHHMITSQQVQQPHQQAALVIGKNNQNIATTSYTPLLTQDDLYTNARQFNSQGGFTSNNHQKHAQQHQHQQQQQQQQNVRNQSIPSSVAVNKKKIRSRITHYNDNGGVDESSGCSFLEEALLQQQQQQHPKQFITYVDANGFINTAATNQPISSNQSQQFGVPYNNQFHQHEAKTSLYFEDQQQEHLQESLDHAINNALQTNTAVSPRKNINLNNNNSQQQQQQQQMVDLMDLADLQKEINDENTRLRDEALRINQMSNSIKLNYLKNRQDKQKLKKLKETLKQQAKKLQAQQQELDYKRQQIHKEQIGIKKSKQSINKQTKMLEQLFQQMNETIQRANILEKNQDQEASIDEFIAHYKLIYHLMSKLHEEKEYSAAQLMQQQQEAENNSIMVEQQQHINDIGAVSDENISSQESLVDSQELLRRAANDKNLNDRMEMDEAVVAAADGDEDDMIVPDEGGGKLDDHDQQQQQQFLINTSMRKDPTNKKKSPTKILSNVFQHDFEQQQVQDSYQGDVRELYSQHLNREIHYNDMKANNNSVAQNHHNNQQYQHQQQELSIILEKEMTSQRQASTEHQLSSHNQGGGTHIANRDPTTGIILTSTSNKSHKKNYLNAPNLNLVPIDINQTMEMHTSQNQTALKGSLLLQGIQTTKSATTVVQPINTEQQQQQQSPKNFEIIEKKMQYDDLIDQVSRELNEIQMIKQDLLLQQQQKQNQSQQQIVQQQLQTQEALNPLQMQQQIDQEAQAKQLTLLLQQLALQQQMMNMQQKQLVQEPQQQQQQQQLQQQVVVQPNGDQQQLLNDNLQQIQQEQNMLIQQPSDHHPQPHQEPDPDQNQQSPNANEEAIQLQESIHHQRNQTSKFSLDFDPDFLNKINQNMMNNDNAVINNKKISAEEEARIQQEQEEQEYRRQLVLQSYQEFLMEQHQQIQPHNGEEESPTQIMQEQMQTMQGEATNMQNSHAQIEYIQDEFDVEEHEEVDYNQQHENMDEQQQIQQQDQIENIDDFAQEDNESHDASQHYQQLTACKQNRRNQHEDGQSSMSPFSAVNQQTMPENDEGGLQFGTIMQVNNNETNKDEQEQSNSQMQNNNGPSSQNNSSKSATGGANSSMLNKQHQQITRNLMSLGGAIYMPAGQGNSKPILQVKAGGAIPNNRLPEAEINRLINEQYMLEQESKDSSVIFKNEKLFDQPKKAIYGIQPAKNKLNY